MTDPVSLTLPINLICYTLPSYDLKGAIRNRFVSEGKNDLGLVLLDENLVRVSCESPLYINSLDKQLLQEAIRRDPAFLASHNMMDYRFDF